MGPTVTPPRSAGCARARRGRRRLMRESLSRRANEICFASKAILENRAMSTGPSVDEGVRTMLLLMPRLVGRAKKLPVPESLRSFSLAPRHLSLLSYLLFDGSLGVNE